MFILIFIAAFVTIISAQAPGTLWTRTIGGSGSDIGFCVQQTIDEGYVIAGRTSSFGVVNEDVWLIKTDAAGDTIWTETFGAAYNSNDFGLSVQQTIDGGYILAGATYSFTSGLTYDVWLIKTDASGDMTWANTFGGSSWDMGYSVQQTDDEGFIIAGYTQSYGAGGEDVWLIKTDAAGDTLWTKIFGGVLADRATSVQQTADGGYIVAGQVNGDWTTGTVDLWLIKTDAAGDTLWTKILGGDCNNGAESVQQTNDGGYIITGHTTLFGAGGEDVWLIKTDASGDTLWTKTFGGIEGDRGKSVQQTADGGYIITGYTSSYGAGDRDAWLIRTDSSGETLWTETFGGSSVDGCNSGHQTSDGGYILSGYTLSSGAGQYDVYLIKLESETCIEEGNAGSSPLVALQSIEPNPFSSDLSITCSIPQQARVELAVFDLSGRLVEELICDQLPAGTHTVTWSPSQNTPNGCYLIELNACGRHTVGRCLKLN